MFLTFYTVAHLYLVVVLIVQEVVLFLTVKIVTIHQIKKMIRHFIVGLINVHELILTLADNNVYRLKLFACLGHFLFQINSLSDTS